MTTTLTLTRTCTYCGQSIQGIARRLSPDSPELVGLANDACYKQYLNALLTAAMTQAGPLR